MGLWDQRRLGVAAVVILVVVSTHIGWYGSYWGDSRHVVQVQRIREDLPLPPWTMSAEERAEAVELLGYGVAEENEVRIVEEESQECIELKAKPLVNHRVVCVLLAMWPEEIVELELVYSAWGHQCDGFYIPVPAPQMQHACDWCRARPGHLFCPGGGGGDDGEVDPCGPFGRYDPPEENVVVYHDHVFRVRGVMRKILEPGVVETWDYVLKTDVDSFIGMVNLKRVLASARPEVPDYRGFVFTAWWDVDNIVWAGGGAYVFSKAALLAIDLDGAPILDKAGEDNFMGLAARDAGVVLNRMADALRLQRVVNVMYEGALQQLVIPFSPFPVALHNVKLPLEDRRETMMSWAETIGKGVPVKYMGLEDVNGQTISSVLPVHDPHGILDPLAFQEPYLTPALDITTNADWETIPPESLVYDLYLNSCKSNRKHWHYPDNTPGLSPTCHTTAPVADCRSFSQ